MELAEFLQALDTEAGGGKSKIVPETLPFPDPIEEADPVTLAERVGIRFEAETPENLGNPVFQYRGHILAWENDAPETKVYAWGLVNLFPGRPLAVDINSMASLLQLSPREVREALSRLTKDGDLVRTWERGRELFRLNIRYTGGIET